MRESESEKKMEERKVFVQRKWSYEECEEMKEIKRMKKKKETVGNRWEK